MGLLWVDFLLVRINLGGGSVVILSMGLLLKLILLGLEVEGSFFFFRDCVGEMYFGRVFLFFFVSVCVLLRCFFFVSSCLHWCFAGRGPLLGSSVCWFS